MATNWAIDSQQLEEPAASDSRASGSAPGSGLAISETPVFKAADTRRLGLSQASEVLAARELMATEETREHKLYLQTASPHLEELKAWIRESKEFTFPEGKTTIFHE
ncbi:unnamed protein product [Protopolystoma xenopodis]|uniref:Uncharacterized protein n=1 Tax=Protopolystoma xenopodis TaxID=117903 RepID=A0A448XM88_9PLAT|nr:unnamed protein product [Protopolystoma xenopodis]